MRTVARITLIIISVLLTVLTACYKEVELPPGPDAVFELNISAGMQEFIFDSRDTSYVIDEPGMELLYAGEVLDLDLIKTRGKTALDYPRKSFAVVLNRAIAVSDNQDGGVVYLSRFKLISMAMDYTYIENRLAFGILEEQGIMPLFYRYVELKINGSTQGIYLLLEDPEQFYLENGSEYILRRGYYNSIEDSEYEPSSYYIPKENYRSRFLEIYSLITELEGEDLYNALNQRLNMEQYFRKMGIDYLLQNGDYTDELYLYALVQQDMIRFNIIPWDYDDIFRPYPHEVGLTWGVGKLFGDRHYPSHQDILDELGGKMVFSIEDDLDYIIARDPYLFERYEFALAGMLDQMGPGDIDALFEQIRQELLPFYYIEEVVAQSRYDQNECNYKIWEDNLKEKKEILKKRLSTMKEKLKPAQL